MTKIAVISDLHIGLDVRSRDLCPPGADVEHKSRLSEENFLEKFKTFVKKSGVVADYLLIPGDLTATANPAEFHHAATVIDQVADSLSVPPHRVIVVPGNHDLDWSVFPKDGKDETGFRRKQMLDPLKSTPYLKSIFDRGGNSLFEAPHFAVWEDETVFVVGYNSAINDDPNRQPHYGTVSHSDIEELDALLSAHPGLEAKVKVFLVHHHPLQYSNPIPDSVDFSLMVNAEAVIEVLHKHSFDFLIHGHKHFPRFCTRQTDARHPLVILGASSFSRQLPFSYVGQSNNLFHLVDVHNRAPNSNAISGVLHTWAFLAHHGWLPCAKVRDGIDECRPFGTYITIDEMRTHVQSEIEGALLSKEIVAWSELCGSVPEWKYYPTPATTELLTQLAKSMGLELIKPSTSSDLYLRKR